MNKLLKFLNSTPVKSLLSNFTGKSWRIINSDLGKTYKTYEVDAPAVVLDKNRILIVDLESAINETISLISPCVLSFNIMATGEIVDVHISNPVNFIKLESIRQFLSTQLLWKPAVKDLKRVNMHIELPFN